MNKKDYYDILGLSQGCTSQDVKKNYHKLALVWHPDKHANKPEAQKKFTEINEAYSILIDANKRQLYDTYGHKGLVEESGIDGYSGLNRKNIFKEKNFAGTNKTAFDVLRDIFAENEEDDFLHTFNPFNMSDTFRSTFKDFMEENIYSSSENEEEDSFFKSYIPTFMDTSFFSSPPLFQSLFSTQNSDSSSQQPHHTQFFSFFSSSMDSDTQSYSKTSSIYVNNGKVQTSTKQRVQKGDTVIENEENNEYNNRPPPLDNKSRMKSKNDLKGSDLIFIEDDESPENPKTRTKKAKKTGKRESPNEHDALKNACRFFDFESISDDDEDDMFAIFGEKGLNFKKKCSKKTKI